MARWCEPVVVMINVPQSVECGVVWRGRVGCLSVGVLGLSIIIDSNISGSDGGGARNGYQFRKQRILARQNLDL